MSMVKYDTWCVSTVISINLATLLTSDIAVTL